MGMAGYIPLLPLLLALLPAPAAAYDNAAPGSRLPPLGWASWGSLGAGASHPYFDYCDQPSIIHAMDAMLALGFQGHGYRFAHVDDCWAGGRNGTGFIFPERDHFPGGIRAIADAAHARGLYLGLYLGGGGGTCVGGRPGSQNRSYEDAAALAEWGVDRGQRLLAA